MKRLLVYVIKIYQNSLGLILPAACRFEPTCSCYAIEAVEKHGALAGILLSVIRIIRCNPWVAGGYDPVPQKISDIIKNKNREHFKEPKT